MRVIEVPEIRGINGGTREQGGRERREGLGRVFEERRIGETVTADPTSAKPSGTDDGARAAATAR